MRLVVRRPRFAQRYERDEAAGTSLPYGMGGPCQSADSIPHRNFSTTATLTPRTLQTMNNLIAESRLEVSPEPMPWEPGGSASSIFMINGLRMAAHPLTLDQQIGPWSRGLLRISARSSRAARGGNWSFFSSDDQESSHGAGDEAVARNDEENVPIALVPEKPIPNHRNAQIRQSGELLIRSGSLQRQAK